MFGRYRLRGRLAAGGMAEVWAAQLLAPGGFVKPMVIKRVLPELAQQPSFLKMLMTEARVAARLSHANVCIVFELGEVDGEYYIAMEYLRGAALSQLLRSGAVPAAAAVALVAQACDGLHYAHEQRDGSGALLGLVHRDVSPHNLLLTVDGVLKVLDFGIAKVDDGESERTEVGKVKGKLSYMSPEQLAAEPLDQRTDVWALGVVLWELLAGKRLFAGNGPAETVDAIRNARVPKLSGRGLGPEGARLDEVLAVAMHAERTSRFTTAAELRRAIVEALSPTPLASAAELASMVWDRCGELVRANDRCFEDQVAETATVPFMPATLLLPRRAAPSEPTTPVDDAPKREDVPAPVVPPELAHVTPPEPPAPVPVVPVVSPAAAPEPVVAAQLVASRGRSWKVLAVVTLLSGAAAIGALYLLQPTPTPRPSMARELAAMIVERDAGPALASGSAAAVVPKPPVDTPPSVGESGLVVHIGPAQHETVRRPRPSRPKPAATGKLFLDARPWATIYVDGKQLGVTPIVGETLSAGSHAIKAVAEDGRIRTLRVTVPANGDVRKMVTW